MIHASDVCGGVGYEIAVELHKVMHLQTFPDHLDVDLSNEDAGLFL